MALFISLNGYFLYKYTSREQVCVSGAAAPHKAHYKHNYLSNSQVRRSFSWNLYWAEGRANTPLAMAQSHQDEASLSKRRLIEKPIDGSRVLLAAFTLIRRFGQRSHKFNYFVSNRDAIQFITMLTWYCLFYARRFLRHLVNCTWVGLGDETQTLVCRANASILKGSHFLSLYRFRIRTNTNYFIARQIFRIQIWICSH